MLRDLPLLPPTFLRHVSLLVASHTSLRHILDLNLWWRRVMEKLSVALSSTGRIQPFTAVSARLGQ